MDENKMFELLEKIYVEVQETKKEVNCHTQRLDSFDKRFDSIDKRFDSLESEVKKIGIKIDEEMIPAQKALLDGYKQNAENITALDGKLDRLQIDVNKASERK